MKSVKEEVLEEFSILKKQMIQTLKKEIDILNKENTLLKYNLLNKELVLSNLNKDK